MQIENRLISKYRAQLFGLAIISIMIFHYFEDVNNQLLSGMLLSKIAVIFVAVVGSIGVEIFVFLSGYGLYFAYSKRTSLSEFYKRRFNRIVPEYLIVAGISLIFLDLVINHFGIKRYLCDLLFVSVVTGKMKTPWFIMFILAMYIAFPLFYKLVEQIGVGKHVWFYMILVIAVMFVLICGVRVAWPELYSHIEVAIWRIPLFAVGVWYGKASREEVQMPVFNLIIAALGLALKIVYLCGAVFQVRTLTILGPRPVNLIYSFFVMFFLIAILDMIKSERLNNSLSIVGSCSLELFLTHVYLRRLSNSLGYPTSIFRNYVFYITLSILCTMGLRRIDFMGRRQRGE